MTADPDDSPDAEDAAADGGEPGATGEGGRLTFPDLPRLELDELLEQLVDRAREVQGTQGRLRGLLRANQLVTGELTLSAVLQRIVDAAQDLVGARYAALGVLGPTGGLSELFTGLPEDVAQRLGELPHGKGLLGALIDEGQPIRLRSITDDPRSVGFPPGHPPMHSFLGVPIRIRGEVFGNLYVTESTRGEFTAEDEELLTALATTAGVAVDNARLYEAARSRGEWLSASAAITRELLTEDLEGAGQALQLIADRTLSVADADLVLVLRPADPADPDDSAGELVVDVAVGVGAEHLGGRRVPLEASLAGPVFTSAQPVALAHLTEDTGLDATVTEGVEVGPVLAVPLLGTGRVHGVLTAARLKGRTAFAATERDMAGSFANHAALAIELVEARAHQQLAVLLDDRERIAADLHDHVIQRLFASGLTLQSLAGAVGNGPGGARLTRVIHDLDDTIRQIRSTIFQLHSGPRTQTESVRGRLIDLLAEVRPALGFEPGLRFSGVLEDLSPELVDDLFAVLREALANVGKHAAAGSADVDVATVDGRLVLRVTDDGRGVGEIGRRSGLDNMRRRAEERGGEFELAPHRPTGTVLAWSVPLR